MNVVSRVYCSSRWQPFIHNLAVKLFQSPYASSIRIQLWIAVHHSVNDTSPPPPIQTEPHSEVHVFRVVLSNRVPYTKLSENGRGLSPTHEGSRQCDHWQAAGYCFKR